MGPISAGSLHGSDDHLWHEIRRDADAMCREVSSHHLHCDDDEEEEDLDAPSSESLFELEASKLLYGVLYNSILQWNSLEEALAAHIASKLGSDVAPMHRWRSVLLSAFNMGTCPNGDAIKTIIRLDLRAIKERDPACPSCGHAFLYFKGFHGIQVHRAANWLWRKGQKSLASLLQSRTSEVFGMDIHPAAQLGTAIMIDHATGLVIGETARVGDGCTLLHGVTLGGNGKQQGDRHPKLGMNVLVGAGASILGNVKIGNGAKIGASAVVLNDIPPSATAVGCPAKVIGRVKESNPASSLDHSCKLVKVYSQRDECLCPYRHLKASKPGYVAPNDFIDLLRNLNKADIPKTLADDLFFNLDKDHDGELLETEYESFTKVLKGIQLTN